MPSRSTALPADHKSPRTIPPPVGRVPTRGAPHRPATTNLQKLPLREDLPLASLPRNPRSGGGWDFQSKEWREAESLSGAITER